MQRLQMGVNRAFRTQSNTLAILPYRLERYGKQETRLDRLITVLVLAMQAGKTIKAVCPIKALEGKQSAKHRILERNVCTQNRCTEKRTTTIHCKTRQVRARKKAQFAQTTN